jgi:hypothetical protein
VRPALAPAALICALAWAGCSSPCHSSSDCDEAQHCDFESGECQNGCTSGADCFSGSCNVETGACRPIVTIGRSDSGLVDAATSTTGDAGP